MVLKAGAQGYPRASFQLGILRKGYGTEPNLYEARFWYEKALEQGIEQAESALKTSVKICPGPLEDTRLFLSSRFLTPASINKNSFPPIPDLLLPSTRWEDAPGKHQNIHNSEVRDNALMWSSKKSESIVQHDR